MNYYFYIFIQTNGIDRVAPDKHGKFRHASIPQITESKRKEYRHA